MGFQSWLGTCTKDLGLMSWDCWLDGLNPGDRLAVTLKRLAARLKGYHGNLLPG